jgi:hypothetical protein
VEKYTSICGDGQVPCAIPRKSMILLGVTHWLPPGDLRVAFESRAIPSALTTNGAWRLARAAQSTRHRFDAPDIMVHGGDLAYGGTHAAEIIDQVRSLGWPGVRGNTDEMLWAPESLTGFAATAPKLAPLLADYNSPVVLFVELHTYNTVVLPWFVRPK